ncbi:NAD(P)-binding oxidoreductase [Streptomyces brasiliensis]|uniref:NAD-dependent dehydratase n=1 Tax=Streptomyces brasiliensis TaxID=1954 RepID=A0A917P6W0_9ACTN|nr:NAD(P)-binding oxidoreductase [Streptomyces brasiliensis]GGJ64670.1 NAD-dependent dehydratase [Streptomyces brasiliensis]
MPTVAIIGAHGKIGPRLVRLLAQQGDKAVGIVRRPEQVRAIERLRGADAVVFSAGAGARSGAARKRTVDYGGSVLAQAAAPLAGVHRFIQVSGMGVDDPVNPDAGDWAAYVRAKSDADRRLRESDPHWTVLRPGALTDGADTGRVRPAEPTGSGSVSRDDVAQLIVACLDDPASAGHQWEVRAGSTPITEAVTEQSHSLGSAS